MATASTSPRTDRKNSLVASASKGTISRPSYSEPPRTILVRPPTAATRSAGHPKRGSTAVDDGAPTRSTATSWSLRRSRTAFVAWVVPSITWLIRLVETPALATTSAIASRMPVVTSGEVVCLVLAIKAFSRSRTTASVCVPPTSMPSRRSRANGMAVLHRDVVEVVAEGAWPGDLDSCGRAPDRRAGKGQKQDALPVADVLGRYRVRCLGVDHGDEVRHAGQHLPVLERDQVLILNLHADEPTCVGPMAFDDDASAHESACRMTLDVDHLALDEGDCVEHLDQCGDGVHCRCHLATDAQCQRHRALDDGSSRGRHRHDVVG